MRILFIMLSLLSIYLTPVSAQANWELSLNVDGHELKKYNEALDIQLNIRVTSSPNADIYVAIKSPDGQLFFLKAGNLFAAPELLANAAPYVSNVTPVAEQSGSVLLLANLPRNLPSGLYQVYALATEVGANVFNSETWLSSLVYDSFYFINNDNNLPIPPQITGVVNEQGQRVFDLTLQKGKKTFLPDTQTDTFGINGDYLGPTIRLSRGDRALFKINNQVGEETTIHWHGLHIPAKMDGGPHQVIEPGSTWQPFFEIKQLAATLWYHSHLEGKTAEHVYKGLAGLFIVDDAESDQLALPRNYGVDDIPVVVQDRRIAANGNMNSTLTNMVDRVGLRGQYMLINGALTPTLETRAQVIRLRLLNGSNARIYNFGFADNRNFYQIASGGGLLQAPVAINRLRLSPGERAEILLDLRQDSGKFLRLQSYSAEITPTTIETANMRDPLDMQTFDLMSIRVGEVGNNGLDIPSQLVTIETLRAEDAVLTRPFVLKQGMGGNGGMGGGMGNGGAGNMEGMFTINDKSMDMLRIDETIRLGDTEIWAISNEANMAHPFHIHDIQFQILDRNGQAPSAGEAGWKDTVLVLPNETVRVITRFEDFADPDSPYMYHCHILEHEDAGMMGQFVVIP